MPSVACHVNLESAIVTDVYLVLFHDLLQTLMSATKTMEAVTISARTIEALLLAAVALGLPSLRMGELV